MEYPQQLNQIIHELQASGNNYSQIVVALAVKFGYALPVAHRIVEAVLNHRGNNGHVYYRLRENDQPYPDIHVGSNNQIRLGDHDVTVVFEQLAPRLVLLDNFMTESECDAICELAMPLMRQARVIAKISGEGKLLPDVRDANSACLSEDLHPLIGAVERRIAALTGWESERGDILQIQRYAKGGKYIPHYDFFNEKSDRGAEFPASPGQRLATLIVYLRSPESGGATYLTNLGMRIAPRRGAALFFSYPGADERTGTLHGGESVGDGEKWILTKWFRERCRPAAERKSGSAGVENSRVEAFD